MTLTKKFENYLNTWPHVCDSEDHAEVAQDLARIAHDHLLNSVEKALEKQPA